MKTRQSCRIALSFLFIFWVSVAAVYGQSENPLPSWRDTANQHAITAFVKAVSTEGSPDFVPEEYRIATLDMDGTILIERPLPVNAVFVQDYLKKVQQNNPILQNIQPYKAARENDLSYIGKSITQVFTTGYMGYTEQDYQRSVVEFAGTHVHPRFNKPYADLFYKPMLELIGYLRSNHFRVYVVSGSTEGFIRGIAKDKTGIPKSNLIGSQTVLTYQTDNGHISFWRNGEYRNPASVRAGKPLMIEYQIGEIPILAFGNSDGDQEMFDYTATNSRRHLVLCLEHDDAEREYVYESGTVYKPGYMKVSMKEDFAVVFGGE